jgi:hypothetical protein
MASLVLGLAASGALLVMAVTGCGGGSSKSTTNTANNATGQTGMTAYLSCLSQHGVHITVPSGRPSGNPSRSRSTARPTDLPSGIPTARRSGGFGGGGFGGGGFGGLGTTPPSGVDAATWQAAQQACASVRPSSGAGQGQRGDNGANAAYLNCLRDHGLASARPNQLNTADPTTAAAMTACAPLRPSASPTG